MKYILFFLLWAASLNAQSTGQIIKPDKKGLNDVEFQRAKDLYLKMTEMGNYKTYVEKSAEKAVKLKAVELIEFKTLLAVNDQDSIHKIMRKNLEARLSETDFKSADEGMALHMEVINLMGKLRKENPELYALLGRATGKQYGQIQKPMQDDVKAAIQQIIYN